MAHTRPMANARKFNSRSRFLVTGNRVRAPIFFLIHNTRNSAGIHWTEFLIIVTILILCIGTGKPSLYLSTIIYYLHGNVITTEWYNNIVFMIIYILYYTLRGERKRAAQLLFFSSLKMFVNVL